MKLPRMHRLGRSALTPLLAGAALLSTAGWLHAATSRRLVPFQARLTDGGAQPLTGLQRVTFTIYDAPTGGAKLWGETHDNVPVVGGLVNVLLGSVHDLDDANGDGDPSDPVLFDATLGPRFLGIKIGSDSNQEMVPRHSLVPSFHARVADTTAKGGVGTEQLADGAVATEKVADGAVTAEKVAGGVLVPAGAIMPYGGTTAPEGWVLCEGQTLDGTNPQYSRLFAAIGLNFGGTGTNFKAPDLRGQFLRGRDAGRGADPDAAQRVGGDVVGSSQGSATISLSGGGGTGGGGSHQHAIQTFFTDFQPGNTRYGMLGGPPNATMFTDVAGDHSHSVFVTVAPPVSATSTEVRPKNVAVNYLIKL